MRALNGALTIGTRVAYYTVAARLHRGPGLREDTGRRRAGARRQRGSTLMHQVFSFLSFQYFVPDTSALAASPFSLSLKRAMPLLKAPAALAPALPPTAVAEASAVQPSLTKRLKLSSVS